MDKHRKVGVVVCCLVVALWDVAYYGLKGLYFHNPITIDREQVSLVIGILWLYTLPINGCWYRTCKENAWTPAVLVLGCGLILLALFPFATLAAIQLGHVKAHPSLGLALIAGAIVLGKLLVLTLMVHCVRSTWRAAEPSPVEASTCGGNSSAEV